MTLAEYFAQFLKTQGVAHVFGLPGGENVAFIEALRLTGIEFVLFSHEASAGYAALVTGQLTNRPGVCLSTVGPGAANLAAAAAAATLERSPMLAITADIDSTWHGRVTHMELDLPAIFKPITKSSFQLHPKTVEATLASAWDLALAPPAGAVHLSLSPDLALLPVDGKPQRRTTPSRPVVSEKTLSQLGPYLQAADNLFFVAGLGVEAANAHTELLALAECWQVPVAVTPKAKGFFPESHPLFAGCFSAYGDGSLRQAIAETDLVIGIGLDSVDFVTSTWDAETPVINLNSAGANDPALKPALAIDGDLRDALKRLAEEDAYFRRRTGALEQAAALRQAIARRLYEPTLPRTPNTIRIEELNEALQKNLPTDIAVTVDVGAYKLVFLQGWRTDSPKSLFVANGLSAMGYAIPGALGIRLAQPDRPVLAIAGDGALLMYAGELATIARIGAPLVILVVVDEALSLIRLKQLRQEVAVYGTEFGRTDYGILAKAFGLDYRFIDGPESAVDTLSAALKMSHPVLVETRITNAEYDRYR